MSLYNWIQKREHGFKPQIGDEDMILKCVYSSFTPYKTWSNEVIIDYLNIVLVFIQIIMKI